MPPRWVVLDVEVVRATRAGSTQLESSKLESLNASKLRQNMSTKITNENSVSEICPSPFLPPPAEQRAEQENFNDPLHLTRFHEDSSFHKKKKRKISRHSIHRISMQFT